MSRSGYAPSQSEIARALSMPADKVAVILRVSEDPIPLDTSVDEEFTIEDVIVDTDTPSAEELVESACLHDLVRECLDSLHPREAAIMRMRFGLDMESKHTLEEVGQVYGLTRERIRQIEAKALKKLRHRSRSSNLREFIKP